MTKTLTYLHVANRTPSDSRPRVLSLTYQDETSKTLNLLKQRIDTKRLSCEFSTTPEVKLKIQGQSQG